jgi:hypothetical protein
LQYKGKEEQDIQFLNTVLSQVENTRGLQLNTFQKACKLLELEYQTKLSSKDFDNAIDLLESKAKASFFITLTGSNRDHWLYRNIGI